MRARNIYVPGRDKFSLRPEIARPQVKLDGEAAIRREFYLEVARSMIPANRKRHKPHVKRTPNTTAWMERRAEYLAEVGRT